MSNIYGHLGLLPAEIRNRIYAYALTSDAPLRVCQVVNLLSVFDARAVETLRLMAGNYDSYHYSGYSFDEASDKRDSVISAIDAFVADPQLMGRALQNFSFLRRATTVYVTNAAPQDLQSFKPIPTFGGPNKAYVVNPSLLATSAAIRREAAPMFYANNTFDFDDVETALSYFVNLEPCYRSYVRSIVFAAMSLFRVQQMLGQCRQVDVAASFCWMLDHWIPSSFHNMQLTMCLKDWLNPMDDVWLHNNMLDFCLGRVAVLKAGFDIGELIIPFHPRYTMVELIAQLALMSGLEHVEVVDCGESNNDIACRTANYPYSEPSGEEHPESAGLVILSRRECGIVRGDYPNNFLRITHSMHGSWVRKYRRLVKYVGLVCDRFELPPYQKFGDEWNSVGAQIRTLERARF